MSIERITRRDIIRAVPDNFRKQYGSHPNEMAAWSKHGRTRGELIERSKALDAETCTAEEMNAAIETNWTAHECDECGDDFDTLVRIGQEPDYEARWVDLCHSCVSVALNAIEPDA